MATNPFENFLPNFHTHYAKVRPDLHEGIVTAELKMLQERIVSSESCLINIFPNIDEKSEQEDSFDPYSEQGRKGGYGKTMLLIKCRNLVFNTTSSPKQPNDTAQSKFPIVELAEEYSTKEDILKKVVENLILIDNDLASLFDDFNKQIEIKKKRANPTGSDPSYLTERLFDEATQKYNWQQEGKSKLFLFFDAFDAQYLGNKYATLRTWLSNQLFPYLVQKMNVTTLVAGREQVNFDITIINKIKFKKYEFKVDEFPKELALRYMKEYPNRTTPEKPVLLWKDIVDSLKLTDPDNLEKSYLDYVLDCTESKPIFLDYFCDLALRSCVFNPPEKIKTIHEFIREIKNSKSNPEEDDLICFKKFVVNRLHIYESKDDNIRVRRQTAETISLLALARHGLNVADYCELRSLGKFSDAALKADEKDLTPFFETIFTSNIENNKGLSYVKNRGDLRLLHDEALDLFLKYWYNEYDKTDKYAKRNRYIAYLVQMYEKKLKKIEDESGKDNSDEYAKLLLEYIEYALMYKGAKEETKAINHLLYEFSYFLDRHPDLSSRLLEKGYKYYTLKKKNWENNEEDEQIEGQNNPLIFSKDFALLFKIRMREAEFCLTNRAGSAQIRIDNVLKELKDITQKFNLNAEKYEYKGHNKQKVLKKPLLSEVDLGGLKARCLVTEGENKFWKNQWDKGKKDVEDARRLFYETGDSHGLAWAEHLLGFEAQRSGEFLRALQHHRNAIEASISHYDTLVKKFDKAQKFFDYTQSYRLRFLLKTLNRANGNLAVNFRYRGKLFEAIKLLESNREIAEAVGVREVSRTETNRLIFYAIRGIPKEANNAHTTALQHLNTIEDPLIKRRLAVTKAIIETKKIGLENTIYTSLFIPQDDDKSNKGEAVRILQPLRENLPKATPFLSLEENTAATKFEVTIPITDEAVQKWFGSPSREIADMYYQYGKAVLSLRCGLDENQNYIEEAKIAFENARFIAQRATFKYLEMECCELLYRITYFSNLHRRDKNVYRDSFLQHKSEIKKNKNDYGIYHDLLAKFYITEGDIALEDFKVLSFAKPNALKETLNHYASALRHGHQHNQERYILILTAFEVRINTILKEVGTESVKEYAQYISAFFEKQMVFKKDATFGLYLNTLLKSEYQSVKKEKEKDISGILKGIRELCEKGKFIKAAAVNKTLIAFYSSKKSDNKLLNKLILAYYQQFYCYLLANYSKRLEETKLELTKIGETNSILVSKNDPSVFNLYTGILELMKGVSIYRKGDLWNMEKFILGELTDYRKEITDFDTAEVNLINSAKSFSNLLSTQKEKVENVPMRMSLLSETYLRLGEYYILSENVTKISLDTQFSECSMYIESVKTKLKVQNQEQVFNLDKMPLSVKCLWYAAYLAHEAKDEHRETDSLQSLINALYFQNFTITSNNNVKEEERAILFLLDFGTYIREKLLGRGEEQKFRFPIVASKSMLVEGDLYFSWLFEKQNEGTGENKFFMRKCWSEKAEAPQTPEQIDYRKTPNFKKSLLHKMLYSYLSALNELTDPNKNYENYHFNNMLLELNRRILSIGTQKYIKNLIEDLRPIWDSFPNLLSKTEVLESLTFSLKVHEVGLGAEKILNQKNHDDEGK